MEIRAALLSHKEKVAQERQRIDRHMRAQGPLTVRNWSLGRTTRRIALKPEQEFLVWSTEGKVVCTIRVSNFELSIEPDLKLHLILSVQAGANALQASLSTDPWNLVNDVFLYVDAVEPLNLDNCGHVNLIVRSGAGVEGDWPDGLAFGTKQEYNQKFADKK